MKRAKIVTKNSAIKTIKAMPLGVSQEICNRDIRVAVVKETVRVLRKKGWLIDCTEKGSKDGVILTINRRP